MLGCICAQSLQFYQKLSAKFTKISHIFHNGCMVMTSLDVQLCACLHSHLNGRKVQNDILLILIYEFNIYLFFQKEGRFLLERDALDGIWYT